MGAGLGRGKRGSVALVLAMGATFMPMLVEGGEADEPLDVRLVPTKPPSGPPSAGESQRHLHLKFVEGNAIRLRGRALVGMGGEDLSAVEAALARHPGAVVRRLFNRPEGVLAEEKARLEARSGRQQADKNLWYRVALPDGANTTAVLDDLNTLDVVESAYREPLAAPLPNHCAAGVEGCTPDLVGRQGYRGPAPEGIDADYAAEVAGGRGDHVVVADLEYLWNTEHEDLSQARLPGATVANGTPWSGFPDHHGTAVVGQLVADANDFGMTGLVDRAGLLMVNTANFEEPYATSLANAVDLAGSLLAPGDVMLIEQQVTGLDVCDETQRGCVPPEWVPAVYDAIVAATSAGVIVVEAAGNGNENLDDPAYGQPFPRGLADSEAIIVGAGVAHACTTRALGPARSRSPSSNYGSRVDLQGWGHCVATTGYGDLFDGGVNRRYAGGFSGTSSAAAIVAGAVAALSSTAQAEGRVLSPTEVRSHLRATGTPQSRRGDTGAIGPQPDLAAAISGLAELGLEAEVRFPRQPVVVEPGGGVSGSVSFGRRLPVLRSVCVEVRFAGDLLDSGEALVVSGSAGATLVMDGPGAELRSCNSSRAWIDALIDGRERLGFSLGSGSVVIERATVDLIP